MQDASPSGAVWRGRYRRAAPIPDCGNDGAGIQMGQVAGRHVATAAAAREVCGKTD